MDEKGAKILEYKGKKIIYINLTGLKGDEIFAKLDDIQEFVNKNIKEVPLLIVDITNSYLNDKVTKKVKEFVKDLDEIVEKRAFVGFMGIKKVILKGISLFLTKPMKVVKTIDEAKEWLVSD